jgi:hypothetical protein
MREPPCAAKCTLGALTDGYRPLSYLNQSRPPIGRWPFADHPTDDCVGVRVTKQPCGNMASDFSFVVRARRRQAGHLPSALQLHAISDISGKIARGDRVPQTKQILVQSAPEMISDVAEFHRSTHIAGDGSRPIAPAA